MNRRQFLAATSRASLLGTAGSLALSACSLDRNLRNSGQAGRPGNSDDPSLAELQRQLDSGSLTSRALTARYLQRIARVDRSGPTLNSIIELNPDALEIARVLDDERLHKGHRGLLHGIPVLIKDNLDTHDRMMTTAGSLALNGSIAPRDSTVAARLRAAGAVILGKTNLSEWANFRGSRSISGWSGRGGQTRNPYCLVCSPSGSSSGSAAAVSANLAVVSVGTETNGSIVSPASYCGIVGIKPTVGLVSRAGIIPISASQDTAGPMARSVADAATLLSVMAGVDPRDPATAAGAEPAERLKRDYRQSLDLGALKGARLGVPRASFKLHRNVDPVFAQALTTLRQAGAELIESVQLPSRQELGGADYQVMVYEFKDGLNAYFASLGASAPVKSMEDLIAFNEKNRDRELIHFGQETLIEAQGKGPLTEAGYRDAKDRCRKWSESLATIFKEQKLDAVVAPTTGPAHTLDFIHGDRGLGGSSTFAAVSGFPHITLPCGEVRGLPVGLSFFGPAWSEPRLIGLAYAFEQAAKARRTPTFLMTIV